MNRVFTLGYEGIDFETYSGILQHHNIKVVLDVRETAWSHKPNFTKGFMKRALLEQGIYYVHVKAVGNPSQIRKTSSSIEECLSRFRDYLIANACVLEELLFYIGIARKMNFAVCLTCFERMPQNCHRSVLLDVLDQMNIEIAPIHLNVLATLRTTKAWNHASDTTIQQS